MQIPKIPNTKGFPKYILVIMLTYGIFYNDFCLVYACGNANDSKLDQLPVRKNDLEGKHVDCYLAEMIKFAQKWINQNSGEIQAIENEITKYTDSSLRQIQNPGEYKIEELSSKLAEIMGCVRKMKPKGIEQKDIALKIGGKSEVFMMTVRFFKSVKDKTKLTYHPWFKSDKKEKLYLVIFIFDPEEPGKVSENDSACGFIIFDGSNEPSKGQTPKR